MTLGELMQAAAGRGELRHLTLAQTRDGNWQGACRGEKDSGYSIEITIDPELALVGALLKRCPDLRESVEADLEYDGPEPEDLL